MREFNGPVVIRLIQAILGLEIVSGVLTHTWPAVFVAGATLFLTFLPERFARFFGIRLPRSVLTAIVVFIFATLFLGEVADFYEKFWWWDVALHFTSALSFGAMGFLLIFMLFEGDRYAAPPWALALLAFCVGLSIGALWEVFEFSMDQFFGMNMQKSGLVDTMKDLIIDSIGAAIGAFSGYLYLKGRQFGGVGRVLEQFVDANKRWYGKLRNRG
ncbi:hypothetical protein [Octadecabacter ascidiaceicola]|uniref:Inner membrane protein YjdF n=1 Tax=Octadecabacter ascidiaceicola TaxID=1655543 RepID=A0A238K8E7_9RHOB|nr:hypothetical protein [Octadecabacter ascidiaceicola]SMX38236.1 hypothetical protein OCA8868_01750 [Octadecabacter ascidiaceicola]